MTTGFTIFTFIIDWKKANFYPPLVLFYLNLSFFAGTWGWMAQFFPGSRDDIVCRKGALDLQTHFTDAAITRDDYNSAPVARFCS